jgi:hypothetical protein
MHSRDLLKRGDAVDKLVLVPVWRAAGEVFSARERISSCQRTAAAVSYERTLRIPHR